LQLRIESLTAFYVGEAQLAQCLLGRVRKQKGLRVTG
jgi:hypothetical protein